MVSQSFAVLFNVYILTYALSFLYRYLVLARPTFIVNRLTPTLVFILFGTITLYALSIGVATLVARVNFKLSLTENSDTLDECDPSRPWRDSTCDGLRERRLSHRRNASDGPLHAQSLPLLFLHRLLRFQSLHDVEKDSVSSMDNYIEDDSTNLLLVNPVPRLK